MSLSLPHKSIVSEYYAHSLEGVSVDEWQRLIEHLSAVARAASDFARYFGAFELGLIAGWLHDLGKYDPDFQLYLLKENGLLPQGIRAPARVDHSTYGAKLALDTIGPSFGGMLAYVVAGHHAGLPDFQGLGLSTPESCLQGRIAREKRSLGLPPEILAGLPKPKAPVGFRMDAEPGAMAFQAAFLTRMLFSCLVDADWLDTEAFCDRVKAAFRSAISRPLISAMHARLEDYMRGFAGRGGKVNELRRSVLRDCLTVADAGRGLFSLTVPTGGGKTLASLSFALRHALKNDMRRVIYVIPFTSIIEQTADVFRRAVGDEAVLEHHCNFDPEDRVEDDSRQKLLADNWDSPLIVTTGVQFYESLFSARTSRCRKLHNIAGSVIIFDEAQTIPVEYLAPCLSAIRELVRNYGCSAVLCTATQPALEKTEHFSIGFSQGEVREIVGQRENLYRALNRTRVQVIDEPLSLPDLTTLLAAPDAAQSLTIVNKRRHAKDLYLALKESVGDGYGTYHLSALMCAAHRTQVLDGIKAVLAWNRAHPEACKPCRVVSTQLVEAGVDVDFPLVYRSLAGVDSIAQAAGRCNREGLLSSPGRVFVFTPAETKYETFGYLKQTAQTTESVLRHVSDPLSLDCVKRYFEEHYSKQSRGNTWDAKGILPKSKLVGGRLEAQFRDIEAAFKLIPEGQHAIVVPYGEEGRALCARIRNEPIPLSPADYRTAQRYSVSVHDAEFKELQKAGPACMGAFRDGRFNVLLNASAYSGEFGLDTSRGAVMEVGSLQQ